MRRALVFGAVVLLLAGCGSRERTISESAVVDAMHRAGIGHVTRLTGPKAPSPSAFELAGRDLFYAGPFRPEGRFELARREQQPPVRGFLQRLGLRPDRPRVILAADEPLRLRELRIHCRPRALDQHRQPARPEDVDRRRLER